MKKVVIGDMVFELSEKDTIYMYFISSDNTQQKIKITMSNAMQIVSLFAAWISSAWID